jgi:hypothetical protein
MFSITLADGIFDLNEASIRIAVLVIAPLAFIVVGAGLYLLTKRTKK